MSWLELDDRILEHPKFIRALNLGGSEAIHLWLGIRAYCGQHLTDGFVPSDMLNEVRGPKDGKKREAALSALKDVRLLDPAEGGLMMHDYLDWSSSREEVLKRRKSASERKQRSRGGGGGDGGSSAGGSRAGTRLSRRDTSDPDAGQEWESPTPARALSSSPTSSTPLPLPPPNPPEPAEEEENTDESGVHRTVEPTNLQDALLLGLQERAAYAVANRAVAQYLVPQRWPEVIEGFRILARIWERDLGLPGHYERDSGTRAVVGVFAAGFTLEQFADFAVKSLQNPVLRGNRAVGMLSPEVVRRTLACEFGNQKGGAVKNSGFDPWKAHEK